MTRSYTIVTILGDYDHRIRSRKNDRSAFVRHSTYRIESREFNIRFRTNAQGYRRAELTPTEHPYRIAFVGDSFTEGMQVEYDKTFCA